MLCSPRTEEKAVGMISLEILAYMTTLDIDIGNIDFNISKSIMSPDRISGGQDGDDVCLSLQGETPGLCEEGDLSL